MFRDRYNRLKQAHADGIADEHPSAQWNRDNVVLRAAKAAGAAQDDNDKPAATYPTEGGGASDAAIKRRPWKSASREVALSLDSAVTAGRSESDVRAVAEGALCHCGVSPQDGKFRELGAYISEIFRPRGAADATRRMIPGLDRLK